VVQVNQNVRNIKEIMVRNAATFLLVALLVLAQPAFGVCKQPSIEKMYEESEVVFSGIVESCETVEEASPPQWPFGPQECVFRVGQVWKGGAPVQVRVNCASGHEKASFTVGGQYLVFALQHEGRLFTTSCTRTTKVDLAVPERFWLGEPTIIDAALKLDPVTEMDLENWEPHEGRYLDAKPDGEK